MLLCVYSPVLAHASPVTDRWVMYFSSTISWDWGSRCRPLTQCCASWMLMKQGWFVLSASTIFYTNSLCSLSRWDWVWIQWKWGGRGRERLRGTQVWGRLGLPTTHLERACSNHTLLWIYCSVSKNASGVNISPVQYSLMCEIVPRQTLTMQKSAYSLSYPPRGMACILDLVSSYM